MSGACRGVSTTWQPNNILYFFAINVGLISSILPDFIIKIRARLWTPTQSMKTSRLTIRVYVSKSNFQSQITNWSKQQQQALDKQASLRPTVIKVIYVYCSAIRNFGRQSLSSLICAQWNKDTHKKRGKCAYTCTYILWVPVFLFSLTAWEIYTNGVRVMRLKQASPTEEYLDLENLFF